MDYGLGMGARGTKPSDNVASTAAAAGVAPLAVVPPKLKGGKEAEAEFRRVAKELAKLGHLNSLQRQCLVNYCEAWAIARDCLDEVNAEGVTLESGDSGNKYMHPALSAWSMARATMEKEAKNLGMTPLSLQSIKSVKLPKNVKKEGPSSFLTGGEDD